jgi:hypothetical protein
MHLPPESDLIKHEDGNAISSDSGKGNKLRGYLFVVFVWHVPFRESCLSLSVLMGGGCEQGNWKDEFTQHSPVRG